MMRGKHLVSALLVSVALSACGPMEEMGGGTPKMDKGALRTCTSRADALAYVRSRAAQFDSSIVLRMPGAGIDVPRSIADTLANEGVISAAKFKIFAGMVIMEPQYADDVVLQRAYRDASIAASLTGRQKAALDKARQIVSDVCSKYSSDYDRAVALHDYIVSHTKYSATSAAKDIQSCTIHVLLDGKGVCEGYTRAYRLLLGMAGIENRYVAGKANGESHCWNLVKLNGQWVHVDCTYDDPLPDESGRVTYGYFGMSDSQASVYCTWNRGGVPSVTSSALYHPFRVGLHFNTVQELVDYCCSHELPRGFHTAYIEELGGPGANVEVLLDAAQRRAGRLVVGRLLITKSNPRALNFSCH